MRNDDNVQSIIIELTCRTLEALEDTFIKTRLGSHSRLTPLKGGPSKLGLWITSKFIQRYDEKHGYGSWPQIEQYIW